MMLPIIQRDLLLVIMLSTTFSRVCITSTTAFQFAVVRSPVVVRARVSARSTSSKLFSTSSSSSLSEQVENGISRLDTLQTLLAQHGAPGSLQCNQANDLVPVSVSLADTVNSNETPELISSMMGDSDDDIHKDLHPHLYPIAKSKQSGNFICGLKRAYADDAAALYDNSSNAPWPIVETKPNGIGMRLLALNSEHLMRRIAVEFDFNSSKKDVSNKKKNLVSIYNDGLGKGSLNDKALDTPYKVGDAEKLG